jgi:E3 ubiquitin-protein ligase UBR2
MLSDTMFWKSARSIVHQYYISIYFMDPSWKREFAILYTRNYKNIWRNYVKNPDDTVSLTDLAVQMFTVISLAKHLMENYSLMQIIMETLNEHSKTSKGKLNFARSRNKSNPEFKRAQCILIDLKYCLTAVPDDWSDSLRKNFILGFKSFVDFIKMMHGMDSLVRQTHTHVEYEPEWETSFNLLIKLARPVSSLIDWCTSDRLVYIECLKYLLHTIYQVEVNDSQFKYTFEKKKYGNCLYEVIDTKVSCLLDFSSADHL